MEWMKRLLVNTFGAVTFFIKYKKHVYMIPVAFLLAASLIVFITAATGHLFKASGNEAPIDLQPREYDISGTTIVLDPGHGGKDPGATSASGITEDEIVYRLAGQLKEELERHGAEVLLTREQDTFASLDARKVEGDLFISLHSDAMDDPSVTGFTTYYTYPHQKKFAETLNNALDTRSYFRNRGVHSMNYQVTWQLDYPAVLVELGYLSNELDDRILLTSHYQELMVQGLTDGIVEYLK
ncbi:N-acetylmuramoyl-L-alanine amidase family protein [Salinicoccus jeotgali]|uniref:MurNAc-LAA domain-containing protein n=1 Tax=Salinicoccus jeotgali TaxID=381634 RepID=A0ABP7EC67_9STAP